MVGAGVAHQRPQLAEEGRHGAGARLRGQRGWRCLHGAVSAGLSAPPRRRGLVKAAESAVFATRPALLRLPARGQVGATCEPAGRGSNRGAAPPDRKGSWDPMFVKKCSGGRDLSLNSILLRPAVSPVVLREKQPARGLMWAGKVLEADAVGTMKSGLEPAERSREGRGLRSRHPPAEPCGVVISRMQSAPPRLP